MQTCFGFGSPVVTPHGKGIGSLEESLELNGVDVTILTSNRTPQGGDLRSEHGLSMFLELEWSDESTATLLFDTGASGAVLDHNLKASGIRVADIDWVVLSHCHGDHTGGLEWLLAQPDGEFLVITHPEISRSVYKTQPDFHFIGMEAPSLRGLGPERWIETRSPIQLAKGIWVSGEIPRVTEFERSRPHMVCLRDGVIETDGEPDDMALALDMGARGGVLLAGCSHAGPVNTVMAASELLPAGVASLVGGLHLYDADESVLEDTGRSLENLVGDGVISGHCTGIRGERMLDATFGQRHKTFYTGDVWQFRRGAPDWVAAREVSPR